MIEQSHNPNAMQAMLEYGKKEKQKMIEGVKYEPVKRYITSVKPFKQKNRDKIDLGYKSKSEKSSDQKF